MIHDLGIVALFALIAFLCCASAAPLFPPNPSLTPEQRDYERGSALGCAILAAFLAYVAGRLW